MPVQSDSHPAENASTATVREAQAVHKLVSLTFDEDPKVRKDAARELARIDDPAALFALMELNYDKDGGVRKVAQEVLNEKKSSAREVMSFAEMFSAGSKQQQPQPEENNEERKERMLSPIRQLFEKQLGKEKAEAVRNHMMPTIEKLYLKNTQPHPKSRDNEGERKVIQEFLTSYLEAISSIERMEPDDEPREEAGGRAGQTLQVQEIPAEGMEEELEEVGQTRDVEKIEQELVQIEEQEGEERQQEAALQELPQTFFKKAYETMMLSNGDEKVMRREMRRMIRDMEHDVHLAFQLARKRFKETNITHLTKLRNGMRNINTDVLTVQQIEQMEYPKGKQKKVLTRLVMNDADGNEGVLYLFENHGTYVQQGMQIRVVRGQVKTFDFSRETALTLSKKGNVYIVV